MLYFFFFSIYVLSFVQAGSFLLFCLLSFIKWLLYFSIKIFPLGFLYIFFPGTFSFLFVSLMFIIAFEAFL